MFVNIVNLYLNKNISKNYNITKYLQESKNFPLFTKNKVCIENLSSSSKDIQVNDKKLKYNILLSDHISQDYHKPKYYRSIQFLIIIL